GGLPRVRPCGGMAEAEIGTDSPDVGKPKWEMAVARGVARGTNQEAAPGTAGRKRNRPATRRAVEVRAGRRSLALVGLVALRARVLDRLERLGRRLGVLLLGRGQHRLGVLVVLLGQLLPRLLVAAGRLVLAQRLAEDRQGLGVHHRVLPLAGL